MFHINPQTGEASPCRAHQGNCPFGSADEHFATREAAEAHYGKTMEHHTFVAHQKADYEKYPLVEEIALKQALETGSGVAEAKTAWERASIEIAATADGQEHFRRLEAGAEPGSPAQAVYQHFLAEGNKLRVQRLSSDELASVFFTKPAEPASRLPVRPALLPPAPIAWASMDKHAQLHGRSTYVSDVQKYQKAVDDFLADPDNATSEQLERLAPAMRVYSGLRWSMAPRARDGSYLVEQEQWSPKAEAGYDYGKKLARAAMNHPQATRAVFEAAADAYEPELAIKHPACPRSFREDHIAEMRGKVDEELLPTYREERFQSNRTALYLAAADPDSFHRQEAFNQLVVADMDSLTEKDRLWMARNMDQFPTSEGTVGTLKSSLRSWVKGYADEAERAKILEAIGDTELAEPEKRGLFRRR